jgi:hypothetical protein
MIFGSAQYATSARSIASASKFVTKLYCLGAHETIRIRRLVAE